MEKRRNYTRLGILVQEDPEKAAAKIKALLKRTKGNASEASRRLGIAHASLLRYFRRLREAGYPVREEGKVGRTGREDESRATYVKRAEVVRAAMASSGADLTENEAEVLRRKYPEEDEPQGCVQIADAIGISRQAVQKAERRALVKIGAAPD